MTFFRQVRIHLRHVQHKELSIQTRVLSCLLLLLLLYLRSFTITSFLSYIIAQEFEMKDFLENIIFRTVLNYQRTIFLHL